MKRSGLWFFLAILIAFISASCGGANPGDPDEVAVLDTNYGKIVIEFFAAAAPKHVANFKKLARQGDYNDTKFHRLVRVSEKLAAIQGGDPNTINGDPATWGYGQKGQPMVQAEFSSALKHERGTVSAARNKDNPDSATSQFFICTTAVPAWDGQYSIFGKVIEGMNIVDSIGRAPTLNKSERPLDPVVVKSVRIVKREEAQ
jgi:cyclophilin family peptidyl-prolyl cis-trans isomerase